MSRSPTWSRAASIGVAVVLLASACRPVSGSPEAASTASTRPTQPASPSPTDRGGVLYAFLRQPSAIDPATAVESGELSVVDQLFDSLTAVDEGGAIVPAAAESWEANADLTSFTFRLRDDLRFHDGTQVTAADFERAFERIVQQPTSARSSAFYLLEHVRGFPRGDGGSGDLVGVVAEDATTLRVDLVTHFADLPAALSHPAFGPVPASAVTDPSGFARQPIGNGPFAMAEPWQPGQFIRLRAFDDHVPGQPELDQVVYRIYAGDQADRDGYQDFRRGNLDVAPVPEAEHATVARDHGVADDGYAGVGLLDGIKPITAFYGFNTEVTPFDDPVVRQALALLVDRRTIVDEVLPPGRAAAESIVPPAIPGYRPAPCAFCVYDPERARELIGDRDLGPLELTYYQGAENEAVAKRVQRDVNEALGEGTLRLRALPQSQWLEEVRTGRATFFLSGWLAEFPAADAFLHPLFHPGRIGTDNVTRYRSHEVHDLLARARREPDPARRSGLYRRAEAQVLRDMPVIPLFHYRHAQVVADGVEGYRITPMGYSDMMEVSVAERR